MFVQVAYLHNILPCPRMLTRPSLFAASGPLRPSHQESPDPGPADPEPGHEGGDRCLYPGERLGGGLLKGPPASHVSIIPRYSTPSLDNTRLWRADHPLPGYVLYTSGKSHTMDYQNGSHVSRSASSPPPTFYLCCKTFPLQTPEARCSWPAAPFKSSFILLFLSFLSSSLSCCSFQARLLSLLKIRGHVLRSLLLPPSTLSLSFSECHNPWKASALHSSVSQKPPI